VSRADGTGPRRLLGWRGSTEAEPSWSPDGERLVFTRDFDPPVGSHVDLYVASLEAGMPRRIASGAPTVAEHGPVWSPDGRMLAVSAARSASSTRGPGSAGG
jgi:Tol biopolymer transport system component